MVAIIYANIWFKFRIALDTAPPVWSRSRRRRRRPPITPKWFQNSLDLIFNIRSFIQLVDDQHLEKHVLLIRARIQSDHSTNAALTNCQRRNQVGMCRGSKLAVPPQVVQPRGPWTAMCLKDLTATTLNCRAG